MGPCWSAVKVAVRGSSVNDPTAKPGSIPTRPVSISTAQVGPGIQTSSLVIYGKGTALASDAIEFDRVYFEIQVKTVGKFAVGLSQASQNPVQDLAKMLGDNKTSWGLKSDMLAAVPDAGDVIGVLFDQSNPSRLFMAFTLNGLPLGDLYDCPRPRSEVKIGGDGQRTPLYPAVSVDKGASIEVRFNEAAFKYRPPIGYQTVVAVRDIALT